MPLKVFKKLSVFLLSLLFSFCYSSKVTLYDNMHKSGDYLTLREISNCTNLPASWQDRTSSLNIHNTVCVKVFEHSDCKGRYMTLKSSLHSESEYLDNLRELRFNDVISSLSPCALQIEQGRYVIQNLGDNKMLTLIREGIYSKVYSKYWRNLRNQYWDISPVAGSTILYEMLPVGEKPHVEQPVIFDNKDLQTLADYKLARPAFLIESVDEWKYVIRDSRTKKCLATIPGERETIKPHVCSPMSKNQQWIFRKGP